MLIIVVVSVVFVCAEANKVSNNFLPGRVGCGRRTRLTARSWRIAICLPAGMEQRSPGKLLPRSLASSGEKEVAGLVIKGGFSMKY